MWGTQLRSKIEKIGRTFSSRERKKERADEEGEEEASGNRAAAAALILGESSFVERLLPPGETLLESNPGNAAV